MTNVKLTKTFQVASEGDFDLDTHTDLVTEELLNLESDTLSDADVSVDFVAAEVTISLVGRDNDFDHALSLADSAIRTAIHAAGGSTPGWKPPTLNATHVAADLITT